MNFIDLKKQYQSLEKDINKRISTVLNHGNFIMGPEVVELEEKLCNYTNSKECITVASGTEALLISLMAIGVEPDDEVIITSFSFISTVEVIVLLKAKPVFVDIDLDTCNIDVSLIEEKINNKTKAIIPVSLYGQPSDMDEINLIASKYNLCVIEDAAQSFGATYKNKKSANLSTIGCTSFFPSKPLGCYGDGGAIFTNNKTIARAAREIRIHGQSERYNHTRIGVGGRMDTIQCAILLAKLERFDWEIEQRILIGNRYNDAFKGHVGYIKQSSDRTSVFAQYTIFSDSRDELQKGLNAKGIPTSIHYPKPLNLQPAYANLCCPECCPKSMIASSNVLSLPMYPDLEYDVQHKIIDAVYDLI